MKKRFKKPLLKGLSLLMAGSFLTFVFPEKSSAVSCTTVYIDNDDPNWENLPGGTWSYQSAANSFRSDHRFNYGSNKEEYTWGSFSEIQNRVCQAVQNVEVHLWNANFTDPYADYTSMTGEYTRKRIKVVNQDTARAGWNYIGAVYDPQPIALISGANNDYNTGADGVLFRPAN